MALSVAPCLAFAGKVGRARRSGDAPTVPCDHDGCLDVVLELRGLKALNTVTGATALSA